MKLHLPFSQLVRETTRRSITCLTTLLFLLVAPIAQSANSITVVSTTSTQSSGLFNYLLPKMQAATGIQANVVAVGTGQAIRLASKGDADVLFVHHRPSEDQFIADGFGVQRYDVMANDFVLVGPKSLQLSANRHDISALLQEIFLKKALFVSRGDDSGTHKKERNLWHLANIKAQQLAQLDTVQASSAAHWYREVGSGMGATLNTAIAMNAITLTDRATWINFANRGQHIIIGEGSSNLNNPYGVMLVNPSKFPHVKAKLGQAFINWLISVEGQQAIADYEVNGQQLFFPTAKKQ